MFILLSKSSIDLSPSTTGQLIRYRRHDKSEREKRGSILYRHVPRKLFFIQLLKNCRGNFNNIFVDVHKVFYHIKKKSIHIIFDLTTYRRRAVSEQPTAFAVLSVQFKCSSYYIGIRLYTCIRCSEANILHQIRSAHYPSMHNSSA